MKIHDFGLWFYSWNGKWETTIPQETGYDIYYDGECLGEFGRVGLWLVIFTERYIATPPLNPPGPIPHIIQLKNQYEYKKYSDAISYFIGHHLTRDDFDIVKNPDYQE